MPTNDFATELKGLKIARYYLVYASLVLLLQIGSWFTGK
jgi:hypothetical protein